MTTKAQSTRRKKEAKEKYYDAPAEVKQGEKKKWERS